MEDKMTTYTWKPGKKLIPLKDSFTTINIKWSEEKASNHVKNMKKFLTERIKLARLQIKMDETHLRLLDK